MPTRGSILLMLCAGALVVLSCADPSSPMAPQASVVRPSGGPAAATHASKKGQLTRLLQCEARATETAVATIGASGGRIKVGPHVLDIPRGALRERVTITAVAPSDTINLLLLQPEGLVFRKAAALTMDDSNCRERGAQHPRIAQVDDGLRVIEYLPSTSDSSKVTALLEYFSNYAVAW